MYLVQYNPILVLFILYCPSVTNEALSDFHVFVTFLYYTHTPTHDILTKYYSNQCPSGDKFEWVRYDKYDYHSYLFLNNIFLENNSCDNHCLL